MCMVCVFVCLSWCQPTEPRDHCFSICFLDNLKRSGDLENLHMVTWVVCVVFVYTSFVCLSWCRPPEPSNFFFSFFLDNLKRSGEPAHGDVQCAWYVCLCILLCVCVSVLVSTTRTTQFLFFFMITLNGVEKLHMVMWVV